MTFPWIYPIRAVQALFGVIVIGLTGYGPSLQNKFSKIYGYWQVSSGFNILLQMVILGYRQLSPLPRLLDCLCSSALPRHYTNMVPSPGTPLCDSCCWDDYHDLLVCRVHRYGSDVAPTKVVSRECLQLAPGSNGIWGVWMVRFYVFVLFLVL